jgi:spermidine/putrescine transport system substrate-binding protein
MNWKLTAAITGVALFASMGAAQAEGELQLYNWGDYTSPELLKKFEAEHKIKVTVTSYGANDEALAKVKAGGHGYDLVVPSANYVQIWIKDGLVVEPGIPQMENFKHMDPKWVDAPYDPGRKFSVPWQWGVTGVAVNTKVYAGDINTAAIILDPPKELEGKINVAPEMNDVMFMAIKYFGGQHCTNDKEVLMKVRDKLKEAKPKWLAMDYNAHPKMASSEYSAVFYWNGAMLRARLENPAVKFGYMKEGFPIFMDNVMLLKDAKNPDNAKTFLNFIMKPENAALISNFAKYNNGIMGSEAFLDKDMQGAPELNVPADLASKGEFLTACPAEVNELYTKIWTDVLK